MIDILSVYLPIILFVSIADESWNCNNPRPSPKEDYYMCQWNESDMFLNKGKWMLRPRDMHDNLFEKIARRKYWKKLGYDSRKIRIKPSG